MASADGETPDDEEGMQLIPHSNDTHLSTSQSKRCLVLGRGVGLVKEALLNLGLHCTEGRVSWRVLWSPRGVPLDLYKQLAANQMVNRLPASQTLTRKDALVINVRRMVKRHGPEHFGALIPKTYLLPAETDQLQHEMGLKPNALWILKPTCGSQVEKQYKCALS